MCDLMRISQLDILYFTLMKIQKRIADKWRFCMEYIEKRPWIMEYRGEKWMNMSSLGDEVPSNVGIGICAVSHSKCQVGTVPCDLLECNILDYLLT